jgi:hypothetical protein
MRRLHEGLNELGWIEGRNLVIKEPCLGWNFGRRGAGSFRTGWGSVRPRRPEAAPDRRPADELAQAAHATFVRWDLPVGAPRMVWKMSIDLDRVRVPSTGQHDPLDAWIAYLELRGAASGSSSRIGTRSVGSGRIPSAFWPRRRRASANRVDPARAREPIERTFGRYTSPPDAGNSPAA